MHKVECCGPIFSKEQTNNINFIQIFTTGNLRLLWYKCFNLLLDERFCVLLWWVYWPLAIVFPYTDRHVLFFPLQGQDNWCSKLMSKVVHWISYIVSCRTYQIRPVHKFTILICRLNQTTQLHQGASPRGLREHRNRRIQRTGNNAKLFSGSLLGSNLLLSITIFSSLDSRYCKQTNIENNDIPFWGSSEERKRFWDQGNLSSKHSREHGGFIDGEQGIK